MDDFDHSDLDDKDGVRNIQPHLGSLQFKETGLEQINPAFDDKDENVEFTKENNPRINRQELPSDSSRDSVETHTNSTKPSNTSTYPVVYSNGGQSGVKQEQVVINKPDGTRVIATEQCSNYSDLYKKRRRPLTKNRILLLKILSVVALVIFFPLGIPAVFFAFRIQKEFDEGIIRGNIDKAQKYAGRVEKLVIFAVMCAILTAVIIFSLVDRLNSSDEENNSSFTNRVLPG